MCWAGRYWDRSSSIANSPIYIARFVFFRPLVRKVAQLASFPPHIRAIHLGLAGKWVNRTKGKTALNSLYCCRICGFFGARATANVIVRSGPHPHLRIDIYLVSA